MKYIFAILAAIIFTTASSAQQYRPFPMSDAYWIYTLDNGPYSDPQFPRPRYQYKQLMFDGKDTTIKGHTYKTIIQREYADSSQNPVLSYTNKIANIPDVRVIAIREDNKRIMAYMLPGSGMSDTTERILYDFNYAIGDIIKTAIHYSNCTVTGSDSLLVGGIYHKQWITNCGTVAEGIGHRWGLYNLGNGQNICSLACFNRDGYTSYSPDSASCFYIHKYGTPTNVTGVKTGDAEFSVSPNPFVNKIDIRTSAPVGVRVLNSLGQVVLVDKVEGTKTIHTSALPAGMYYVELVNRAMNIRTVEKIVK